MPYIGNTIRAADDYRLIDDISSGFNGSATSFALQVAGSAPVPFPKSPQQVLISVNGVIQEPDPTGSSGFNLVGTNIVFSSAPTNGHAFFGIIYATADYLNAGGNFPAGSLGAPSITFIGDENTGLFRKSGGSVGFVSDATEIANFDSNGITISSGNLIIPDSIIHSGDSDTKIRFPADNAVSIETGGAQKFKVDNSGNVLIGDGDSTSVGSPDHDVVVSSTTNNEEVAYSLNVMEGTNNRRAKFFLDDNDGVFGIDTTASTGVPPFVVRMAQSEKIRVDQSGNIGIGTASPSTIVHIQQSAVTNAPNRSAALYLENNANCEIQFVGNSSNDCQLRFGTSNNSFLGAIEYELDNANMEFYTGGSERLRILGNGRVGIGVTSPAAKLQVAGSAHITAPADSLTTDALQLSFSSPEGHIKVKNSSGAPAANLAFHTTDTSGNTNRVMHLKHDGTVGVGTNSPLEKLHVNGGDIIISTGNAPNLRIVRADNSSGSSTTRAFFGIATGTNNFMNGSVDNDTCLVYSQGGKLLIGTGTSVEAGFDSSGNFGVGSPSPDSRISIVGTGSDAVTRLSITDSTGKADFNGRYGNIVLNADRNAAVAGSLMAFKVDNSERMRIAASGAVGIGTSNPAYQLNVKGGNVDQVARFENTKTTNGQINYIGVSLDGGGRGVAIFGHTGHTTAASQAAWIGCVGDDVAGGTGVKAFRGGNVVMMGRLLMGVSAGTNNVSGSDASIQVSYSKTHRFGIHIRPSDNNTGGGQPMIFQNQAGGSIGSIGADASNVSFNTSSDYRLKENDVPISDGITRLKQLRPIKFNWKVTPEKTVDGFFAHEVTSAVPEAVTGEKDAVFEDNSIKPQQLDYTKLVPLLTSALQEAVAKIETLETEVAALKAA